ncbi:hypothetical protein HDU93_004007 [Gonapodya sp. JEL0774]|nr:hypothetical protein HDU93_004007 [Gonapodya sp. JEL0774]
MAVRTRNRKLEEEIEELKEQVARLSVPEEYREEDRAARAQMRGKATAPAPNHQPQPPARLPDAPPDFAQRAHDSWQGPMQVPAQYAQGVTSRPPIPTQQAQPRTDQPVPPTRPLDATSAYIQRVHDSWQGPMRVPEQFGTGTPWAPRADAPSQPPSSYSDMARRAAQSHADRMHAQKLKEAAQRRAANGSPGGSGVSGRNVPGRDTQDAQPNSANGTPHPPGNLQHIDADVLDGWQVLRARRPKGGRQWTGVKYNPANPNEARPLVTLADKKRAVDALVGTPAPPTEFVSVFIAFSDNAPLLRTEHHIRIKFIRAVLKRFKVDDSVTTFTMVPGLVVQLFVPIGHRTYVSEQLTKGGVTVLPTYDRFSRPPHSTNTNEFDLQMTAKRLAGICRSNASRNLHEEVLAGAPDELRRATLEAYRQAMKEPTAQLGHVGRWYAAPAADVNGRRIHKGVITAPYLQARVEMETDSAAAARHSGNRSPVPSERDSHDGDVIMGGTRRMGGDIQVDGVRSGLNTQTLPGATASTRNHHRGTVSTGDDAAATVRPVAAV